MTSEASAILITGAGSGIGRELARTFAREGHPIAAVDVSEDGLRALADELHDPKLRLAWGCADVTDPDALAQTVRTLEATLGPIGTLIASAGIGTETSGLSYNIAAMSRIIHVNLIGVSNSIGVVLPGMLERRQGHLVAISSIASYRGLPRMLGYCASKAGVNAIMDGLRVELAPLGIATTTICPGWVRTPMTEKIEGKLDHLLDVKTAAREIAYAIRHRLPFYTFPRGMRWSMGILTALPRTWQDRYIRRKMDQLRIQKPQASE